MDTFFTEFNFFLTLHMIDSLYELRHEISNNEAYATSKASDQSAHMCRAFANRLNIL